MGPRTGTWADRWGSRTLAAGGGGWASASASLPWKVSQRRGYVPLGSRPRLTASPQTSGRTWRFVPAGRGGGVVVGAGGGEVGPARRRWSTRTQARSSGQARTLVPSGTGP